MTYQKCPCCDGWGVRTVSVPIDTVAERTRICPSCNGSGVLLAPSALASAVAKCRYEISKDGGTFLDLDGVLREVHERRGGELNTSDPAIHGDLPYATGCIP